MKHTFYITLIALALHIPCSAWVGCDDGNGNSDPSKCWGGDQCVNNNPGWFCAGSISG